MKRELDRGVSQDQLAKALYLDSAAMVGRFTRLARLPQEVGAAVGWGRVASGLNLTQAQEVARLPAQRDMREMARLVLEYELSSTEVRGAVQICLRRAVAPEIGVGETVKLRPVVERRYVQLGRVIESELSRRLGGMTDAERQQLVQRAVARIGIEVREARLQKGGYTLVLEEAVASSTNPDATEASLNRALSDLLQGTS